MNIQAGLFKVNEDRFELHVNAGAVILSRMNRQEFADFVDWCNKQLRLFESFESDRYLLKVYEPEREDLPGRPHPLE
jgi:hypothetical protein